jgi:glycosyltransferase involved in cell wall biosynthesis
MGSMPTISVIIPAYNQAIYLPDAINSIINQTFEDWECIIVNDGSSDNTHEVIQSYLSNNKFIYITQPNRGLAAARNRGIDESSGKYVQFLDADDVIEHTKLEKQLLFLLNKNELALSYTDYFSSSENNLNNPCPEGRYLPPVFLLKNKLHDLILRWETEISIPVHCFIFDARFFNEFKIRFDESLPNHEDWDCWMNIFRLRPSVQYIPEKLATYRIHKDSMMHDWRLMKAGYIKALLKQRKTFEKKSYEYNLLLQKIKLTKKNYEKYSRSIIIIGSHRIKKLISHLFPFISIAFVI